MVAQEGITVNPLQSPILPNGSTSESKINIGKNIGKNFDKYVISTSSGKLAIAIVILFIIIYVLIYIYNLYTSTSLQTTTLLKKPVSIPYGLTSISKVKIPSSVNGSQYSISLWIYVDNLKPTVNDRFILGRGNSEYSMSPIIKLTPSNNLEVIPQSGTILRHSNFQINRWVNIVLVVDETLAQLYIDSKFTQAINLNNSIYSAPSGNVQIGKTSEMDRIDGYLSKVQLFNYAITIDHTKIIYKAGPLHKSILSSLGIPLYGLRNPFTRLDDIAIE
jgi:hypothetical protein